MQWGPGGCGRGFDGCSGLPADVNGPSTDVGGVLAVFAYFRNEVRDFLMDVNELLLGAEGDMRLSEEERWELRRNHTRKLCVGLTWTGQRLVVIRSGSRVE